MDAAAAAIVAAVVIALLLFIAYFVVRARERGRDPSYYEEVYLFRGPALPAGATVAAPGQIAAYRAAGGRQAAGAISGGGAWLYGPKPRLGTPGVAPFDGRHWFQPRGAVAV